MHLLLNAIFLLMTAWSINAQAKCPEGWTSLAPDGVRMCYIRKYLGSFLTYSEAKDYCAGLHPDATLPMPKTTEQEAAVASMIASWGDTFPLGIEATAADGDVLAWLDGDTQIYSDRWQSGEPNTIDYPDGGLRQFPATGGNAYWEVVKNGDVEQRNGWRLNRPEPDGIKFQIAQCRIKLKEWSCLEDRVKASKSPFNHYAHQGPGCRQVLTCNARFTDDDGALVNGLTVNLEQSSYHGITADINLVLQNDLLVSIAFTEGTSPRADDGTDTCNAESLGLFLSHHSHTAEHHSNGLLSALLAGHTATAYGGMHGGAYPYYYGHGDYGHGAYGYGHGHPIDAGHFEDHQGLVKQASVTGGVKANFNIQRVGGFTSLAELAGHGVVVCASDNVEEKNGVMRCLSDEIPVCCSLGWALEADEQFLD